MKSIQLKRIGKFFGIDCDSNSQIFDYQIDSRKIAPQGLFFALKGEKVDGHKYLKEVALKGALAAVVSKNYRGPDFGLTLLPVDDVVDSLQKLANFLMQGCSSTVVGITGSLGKTTTKEFLATLLEEKFKVGKTHLNYNTKLTYPITLLNRRGDEEVLVVELGMTEPGDLQKLLKIAAPDIAVLTKIAFVHAAYFKGEIEKIAWHKAQIFTHPKTRLCIFDHALYNYPKALEKIQSKKLSFSLESSAADLFLSKQFYVDERGVRAYQFDPPYKQRHLLHDFLAAIAVARALKMDWDEINRRVSKLKLPKMRFEIFERGGIFFINDTYNASPESMKAALEHLPEPQDGGKRIAILGMMVDMGQEHEKVHREVGLFAQKYVDHLFVLGKEAFPLLEAFKEVQKPAEQYVDFHALSKRLKKLMRPKDVVLFKASRCVQMEKLLELLVGC